MNNITKTGGIKELTVGTETAGLTGETELMIRTGI